MSKKKLLNIGIILCAIFIVILQVVISTHLKGFAGTDDQSVDIIKEISPDYTPWVNNVWEHSNEWAETLLFAVQASLGLGIIIFYILKQRKKTASLKC